MKTTIGGDRLGSGNKQDVRLRNYERSTHDLGYLWRSSMSAGTLVPFMSELALPGDTWDIDLNCEVLTLPTIGPLFGSYKVQLDVFHVPIRLYNGQLHMNKLGIGMDMSKVKLPQLLIERLSNLMTYSDNADMNPSCILKYLGISGIGNVSDWEEGTPYRMFNAVPFLAYWDIYKNYYANKMEKRGFAIHIDGDSEETAQRIFSARAYEDTITAPTTFLQIYDSPQNLSFNSANEPKIVIAYGMNASQPNPNDIMIMEGATEVPLITLFETAIWNDTLKELTFTNYIGTLGAQNYEVNPQSTNPTNPIEDYGLSLEEFPLANIDQMRKLILQHDDDQDGAFVIDNTNEFPYSMPFKLWGGDGTAYYSRLFSQEGLGIKTYQSDLFNNWIDTEFIDGENGVNAVSAVSTAGDSFTIDALNLAQKVYVMLNRIAISSGDYDSWLDATYTHERAKSVESPVYHGSLIKELAFEEVISNAQAGEEPLGTLAGRGRLTNKNKGGKMVIKIDEPSYIMGIVSLTPRVDYSQGNKWDVNLKTMNDLHKPALDAIGYQNLITEQMVWSDTTANDDETLTQKSAGKQPAWINYMTAVNRTYGNFADRNKEMFMTLNRRYEIDETTGEILDLTTYVDPKKFNHIFADTNLDAQNFWVQIANNITARRKMSAKVIPNL